MRFKVTATNFLSFLIHEMLKQGTITFDKTIPIEQTVSKVMARYERKHGC